MPPRRFGWIARVGPCAMGDEEGGGAGCLGRRSTSCDRRRGTGGNRGRWSWVCRRLIPAVLAGISPQVPPRATRGGAIAGKLTWLRRRSFSWDSPSILINFLSWWLILNGLVASGFLQRKGCFDALFLSLIYQSNLSSSAQRDGGHEHGCRRATSFQSRSKLL